MDKLAANGEKKLNLKMPLGCPLAGMLSFFLFFLFLFFVCLFVLPSFSLKFVLENNSTNKKKKKKKRKNKEWRDE